MYQGFFLKQQWIMWATVPIKDWPEVTTENNLYFKLKS
jgi:hypothetical protein